MNPLKPGYVLRLIQVSNWFDSQVVPGETGLVTITVDDQLKKALDLAIGAYAKEIWNPEISEAANSAYAATMAALVGEAKREEETK